MIPKLKMNKPYRILYSDNGEFKNYPYKLKPKEVIDALHKNIKEDNYIITFPSPWTSLMSSFGPDDQDAYVVMFYDNGFAQIWDVNQMDFRTKEMCPTTIPEELKIENDEK